MSVIFKEDSAKRHTSSQLEAVILGPSLMQKGGMATVQQLILTHVPNRIKVQHICTHDEGSLGHRGVVFLKALFRFCKILLSGDVDLVHVHLSERGSIIRKTMIVLLCFAFRTPVLVHTHGAEFKPCFLGLPKWLQRSLAFLFRRCDGFIVLSESWQQFYVSQLSLEPRKVFTLPNAVELPAIASRHRAADVVRLVFCGRVGERKGAFVLIEALAALPTEIRARTELILAGDGELQQGKALAERLHISHQVTFAGWVNQQQRDQLLQQADIFILPSLNEGLPMSMLEAMAWGLPVIVTPVGGIPEVVQSNHNGLLVAPGDMHQLMKAIQLLVEDEPWRLTLGQAARKTVESFDIRTYGHRLADIYDRILLAR